MSYGEKQLLGKQCCIFTILCYSESEHSFPAEKVQGTVKWFNCDKGYGFISRADNGEDVFVHSRSISRRASGADTGTLEDGETVEFDVVQGQKVLS